MEEGTPAFGFGIFHDAGVEDFGLVTSGELHFDVGNPVGRRGGIGEAMGEVDDVEVVGGGLHDKATASGKDFGKETGDMFLEPVEAVFEVERFFRRGGDGFGLPEGDDVVPGLLTGGEFDEAYTALAKAFDGLDPDGGAKVVVGFEILKVFEVAVALAKAKAFQFGHFKEAEAHVATVVEGTPESGAAFDFDLEAIGVVDFGAEVVGFRVGVLAVPEHGGEGGEAEHFHGFADIEAAGDEHAGGFAGHGGEAVGTGDAGSVEEGEAGEEFVILGGGDDPEMSEVGKLFGFAADGVDGDASGGDAIAEFRGDGAEVAGAHEDEELEAAVGHAVWSEDAEAGVSGRSGGVGRDFDAAVVEEFGVEGDGFGLAGNEVEEADGFFEHPAGVEELDAEGIVRAGEEGFFGDEADLAMVVVFQAFVEGIQIGGWGFVRSAGEFLGEFLQAFEVGDLKVIRRGGEAGDQGETDNDETQRKGWLHVKM